MKEKKIYFKSILITLMITSAVVLGLAVLNNKEPAEKTVSEFDIRVTPSPANLGAIKIEKTPVEFKDIISIENVTNQPIKIKNINTSCGCTTADLKNKILSPDQSIYLDLKIGPSTIGAKQVTIWVEVDNPKSPIIEIPVRFELLESVKVHPNYLELAFNDNKTFIDSHFHLTGNDIRNFDKINISMPSEKKVVGQIVSRKVIENKKGRPGVDLEVRWKVEDYIKAGPRNIHFAWKDGWKSISANVSCVTNYKIQPSEIFISSLKIGEKSNRSLQISRVDKQPFMVKDFSFDIPFLEIIPLDKGYASVHNFQVSFQPNQKGIIKGKIKFNATPPEKWPIELGFYALTEK